MAKERVGDLESPLSVVNAGPAWKLSIYSTFPFLSLHWQTGFVRMETVTLLMALTPSDSDMLWFIHGLKMR
jgi:hypothetical protein